MNDAIQFHSRVGDDGILDVQVNLGRTEAKKEVVVTIEPLSASDEAQQADNMPWPDFVERTYGSCAELDLDRHEQGAFESREAGADAAQAVDVTAWQALVRLDAGS